MLPPRAMRSVIASGLVLVACGGSVETAAPAGEGVAPPPGDGAWTPVPPPNAPARKPVSCHPNATLIEQFDLHELPEAFSYFYQVLALETGDVLARSHDTLSRRRAGSAAWEPIAEVPYSEYPRFAAATGQTVWMGGDGATRFSLDGGASWTKLLLGEETVQDAVPSHLGADQIVLGREAELVIVSGPDATATVVALPSEDPRRIETVIRAGDGFLAVDALGGVARAADLSGPWSLGAPLPGEAAAVWASDRIVALTWGGAAHWSFDGGASWEPAGQAAESDARFDAESLADGTVVATATGGIQLSCDRGATFEQLSLPETGESVYDLAIAPDGDVWAASSYRIFRVRLDP